MTALVALMNKHGIAFAADSAVTTQFDKRYKIFNTVDKIFRLSNTSPIGAMIYNSASLAGLPIEVLFKDFRNNVLQTKKYSSLNGYSSDLIDYFSSILDRNPEFICNYDFENYVCYIIDFIHQQIISKFPNIENSIDYEKGFNFVVEDIYNRFPKSSSSSDDITDKLKPKIFTILDSNIKMNINKDNLTDLIIMFSKENFTGIIISGYGEKDLLPTLIEFKIHNYFLDKENIIYDAKEYRINDEQPCIIKPFAQREQIDIFINGYDERIQSVCVINLFDDLSQSLHSITNEMNITTVDSERIDDAIKKCIEKYKHNLINDTNKKHKHPIETILNSLPFQELAEMAETLIKLECFKKHISSADETVGEPIDVAVITKGDGFIWIKRKHYFKPEQNYHFFTKHF